jgi:hypothetical protein
MRIFSRTTNHEDMVIPGMRRWATSCLTRFSIDGEYTSNTFSERRELLLRASATPSNGGF